MFAGYLSFKASGSKALGLKAFCLRERREEKEEEEKIRPGEGDL